MGDSEHTHYPNYERCDSRIITFATWRQYDEFDKDDLAQAGLYNIADGTTDAIQVRCFCCGQEFNNISPEDDFLFQHFKRSPNCRYLRQKLGTDRIKEYEEQIHTENQIQQQVQGTSRNPGQWTTSDCIQSPQYQAYSVRLASFACWSTDLRQRPELVAEAGFYCTGTSRNPGQWSASDCIQSPQYQAYSIRLASFACWPTDLRQTPELVADAGFYYTGLQDVVRCFACDGGLKNWDPDDDPWIEHARWFPQCPFVKHVKGQNFIDLVQRMAEESDEEEDEDSKSNSDLNYSVMATSDLNREADFDLLTNDDARRVLEAAYTASTVTTAVNTLLNKGHSEFTADQLLEVILDMEDRGETKCNENASSSSLAMNANQLQCSDQSSAEATRPQQRMQCAYCGRVEISFIWCNNHCNVRNCEDCKFICFDCSNAIRDMET